MYIGPQLSQSQRLSMVFWRLSTVFRFGACRHRSQSSTKFISPEPHEHFFCDNSWYDSNTTRWHWRM